MTKEMESPLKGIRILDFTTGYSGPLCAMMLGDMGAEVIKVEKATGDPVRWTKGPAAMHDIEQMPRQTEVENTSWLALNRSKKSLAVDLGHAKGREIILRLVKEVNVLLESFRRGVMEKYDLDYESVSKINPGIIYSSQTAFGEEGPYARRIGGDMWAQGMGGVVSYQGSPNGPPYMAGTMFVDEGSASIAAFGVMVALFVRERTEIGQHLTSSLLHSVIHMQSVEVSDYLMDGKLITKIGRGMAGMVPGGAYRAKDGDLISIFGVGPQWPALCKVLGIEHVEKDPRFNTHEKRQENREELYPILDEAFSKKTRAEWQKIFREAGMRVDPCLNYEELFAHPQVEANQMVVNMEHPVRGTLKTIAPPVKLKRTPAKPQCPPPLLGQHTEEILLELGYRQKEVDELEEMGVIKRATEK